MKKILPYIISILAAIIVNMMLETFDISAYILIGVDILVCMLVELILNRMKMLSLSLLYVRKPALKV